MRLVGDRDVLRAVHVPARRPPARPDRERRHAGILVLAVDVDVVAHVGPALGGHGSVGQVVVHHRGAERVRDHVDLGLSRPQLERGDRVVDLLVDLALVTDGARRVVVDLVDPGRRVAVALEAQRLRLELRARALDAMDEEDGVVSERVSRASAGQYQHAAGESGEQQAQQFAMREPAPNRDAPHVVPSTESFVS